MFPVLMAALAIGPGRAMAQSPATHDSTDRATLAPGDQVRLKIWREPDLSGDFTVDEAGMVVLPKLGAYHAADIPVDSLRVRLTRDYSQYLTNPAIEVMLLRRVQVLGAVKSPGLYHVDGTMTVQDGLALAGGVTSDGNPNHIELIRDGRKLPVSLTRQTHIGASAIESGDQIYVPERSWISRNPGVIIGLLSAAATLVIALHR